MKNSITPQRGIAAVVVTAALALAIGVGPAMAAPGDTPVTLTVTGGGLAISVNESSVSLGAAVPGASTDSVNLGNVVVTDTRAGTAGWIASAASSNITSGDNTIPMANVGYTAPAASETGTSSVAATDRPSLTGPLAVQTATGVVGNNTATWSPGIVVLIPTDALAASNYAGVITTSVA